MGSNPIRGTVKRLSDFFPIFSMAILANRHRKNRNNFGKFENGISILRSSNILSRKLLKKVFSPPRFRPQSRGLGIASQNRKIFSTFFLISRAQIFFKKEKKIFLCGACPPLAESSENSERRKRGSEALLKGKRVCPKPTRAHTLKQI